MPLPIRDVAKYLGLLDEDLILYGEHKAKIRLSALERLASRPQGKIIIVTAITPTPAGEGKTVTTIGLGDALRRIGERATVCIREPSLGPVFGVKGGGTGGGKAQAYPADDINLHFTGDIHAVTAAHNLLAAMIEAHIHHGNSAGFDAHGVWWNRVLDVPDRSLRKVITGLGGKSNGVPRETGFEITAASEIMAVLSLSTSWHDLRRRLGQIVVGVTRDGSPIAAEDIGAAGAMSVLMRDALMPNLVQTLEGVPLLIHAGPFGNIATGCNSVLADRIALQTSDYVVTEAGFGADLGAEKFFNIKCRIGDLHPSCVVLVASIRALKWHGGAKKKELEKEDISSLKKGISNLLHHVHIIKDIFHVPLVIAINRFPFDTDLELKTVEEILKEKGIRVAISEVYEKGSEGGIVLAEEVLKAIEGDENGFRQLYNLDESYEVKIEKIVKEVYGGEKVIFSDSAKEDLERIYDWGFNNLPICMAKTQYSLSDNPKLRGKPNNFFINVNKIKLSLGAGFLVVYTGDILTMPGLPKIPSAEKIDIDEEGNITGL